MLVNFRQGLVRAPANFIQRTGSAVSLQVPPNDTVIATIADGSTDYLISERQSISNAWAGPFNTATDYWLYWDLHPVTGVRTFGHTIYEPVEGPTPPASAHHGQHWFDTSSKQMKVFNNANSRWTRVIRVFAAQLAQGGVFVSMSINSPAYVGTQAGLTTKTNAGALIFDNFGSPLKKKDGTFFTSEDFALTGISNSSQVKLASVQIQAEAETYLPAMTIVRFSALNKVAPASNHLIAQSVYGIVEHEANIGDVVNVTMDGIVQSNSWDWTSVGANAKLYIDGSGTLTPVPSLPAIAVATVVATNAILLRTAGVGAGGGSGDLGGIATSDILVPSTLKIEMVDAPVTPTSLTNKTYVDSLFAQTGTQSFTRRNSGTTTLPRGAVVYVDSTNDLDMYPTIATSRSTSLAAGVALNPIAQGFIGAVLTKGVMDQSISSWDAITGDVGGLLPGRDYFISAAIPGGLTHTPPSIDGHWVVRVGKALTSTRLDINIEPPIEL